MHERLSSIRSEKDDFVPLGHAALHPRRSGRHTRNSQADCLWPLLQQPAHRQSRYMAFDDVSRDFGGVTRGEIGRYAKPFPDGLKVCGFFHGDGEARVLEMLHPTHAATAVRILVNKDRRCLCKRRLRRHDQRQRDYSECASPCETARMNDR
jgi:hypothetical protein